MKKQHLQMPIIDAARAVLIVRSNEPEVRREIAALLGSLDGNLSNEQVLERLKALRAGASSMTNFGIPAEKILADQSSSSSSL